jgi:hypothetical protein
MSRTDRDTYLQIRELLGRAIKYALAIDQRLGQLGDVPAGSRTALLQQSLKAEQHNVTTALERYAADAPASILDTVAQYSIALPEDIPPPAAPLTPDALEAWVLDLHRPLFDLFSELAEVVEATPARLPFENLAAMIKNHEMRIVQAAESARAL